MKTHLFALTIIAISAIPFSSCQKNLENKSGVDEISGTPLPGQPTYCRIESIRENPNRFDERYRLVLYDEYENPVAITTPVLGTGINYHQFRYDQWHRLKDYIAYLNGGQFQTWHIYGYDNSGRIGYDTLYWFGQLGEKPTNYWFREYQAFEYDNQNRIIRINYHNDQGNSGVVNYEYDAAGNLIHPASEGVTYDNKINLNRTNDIWMFLSRDYSMNNPFGATSYNAAGYPTKMSNRQVSNWAGTEISLASSEFSYGCRPAHW